MTAPILFEDFRPGEALGESVEVLTPELEAGWRSIFGDEPTHGAGGAAQGAGLAVVLMMRAYLAIVTPRPPGNVHARQRLSLRTMPRPGEAVRTTLRCESKELRRERRYVEIHAQGTGEDGRLVYDGRLSLIWAA